MASMERTGKQTAIFFAALAVTAFFVNFCWESLHGLLYKAHPEMAASDYVPMMLSMASMDVFAILGLFFFTSLLAHSWLWTLGLRNCLIFSLSGLITAYTVEYVSIFILHLWQYQPSMPILLGVGLFPLVQLSLTGLFSLYVARRVAGEEK